MQDLPKLNKPKYSAWSNALYVLKGIREYDSFALVLVLINAAFSAIEQFVPVLMPKYVIDELMRGGDGQVHRVLLIILVSSIIALIAEGVSRTSRISLNNRFIIIRLRFIIRSGKKFMTTDFQSLENPNVLDMSEKGDRACSDNQNGVEGVMHRLLSISGRVIVLTGCGAVLVMLHPLMILAIAALLVVNFLTGNRTRRLNKQIYDTQAPVRRKVYYLTDTMRNFAYGKDIRLFGLRNFLTEKLGQQQKEQYAGTVQTQKLWLYAKGVYATTAMLQEVLLYAWLCWQVLAGRISIGDFTMYGAAIRAFSSALGGLLDDVSHIKQQNEVISDYRTFLDYPNTPSGTAMPPANLHTNGCTFTFEHVSFRYPGREEYALKDVSLEIKAGERLAIVGLNGAGKTTFVKLLTRLYEPEFGCILLNGVDIRTYDKQAYYGLFSIVFQEIQLFAFCVAENVAMCEYHKIDLSRAAACIEKAGLGSKILTLPKGIDTSVLKVIDENGIEFSGGENQKLALARALYKNAPVLVLDEPTAALDALAEERLYREFDALIGDRTAIYISHRLSSTRFCDRVALFAAGEIVELGTHEELMHKGGKYAEMFTLQSRYYREETA